MRLRIQHSTVYDYSEAVAFGRHRLVIRPREGHDVRVEEMRLSIEPEAEVAWTRDVFGNSVAWVDFLAPGKRLAITSDVEMTRRGTFPMRGTASPWLVPFPVVYEALESAVAAAYRATTYGEDAEAVREFLQKEGLLVPPDEGAGAEMLLDMVNRRLFSAVTYNRRPEKGTQTPVETLTKRSGSCRDIATLMLEGCRMLGIATRFVSGYLDCAASEAGRASTHAWIEAYLPPHGWIGFDPTLGERTSEKHIACGVSNHPRGVMPVSGTYERTASSEYLGMTVGVRVEKVGE